MCVKYMINLLLLLRFHFLKFDVELELVLNNLFDIFLKSQIKNYSFDRKNKEQK